MTNLDAFETDQKVRRKMSNVPSVKLTPLLYSIYLLKSFSVSFCLILEQKQSFQLFIQKQEILH